VLNVERSLLGRRDPHRKAPYAAGHDFPTTLQLKKGNATPAGATASCRDARNHLGLNQGDFARLVGKNDSTVETWESPNPKRRIEPPLFMQQMFGAFMHAQAPNGWELRRMINVDGPVRAVYWLLRSAFDGPQLRAAAAATP
jgi:DNA-binding XRE family transcriptional regulator